MYQEEFWGLRNLGALNILSVQTLHSGYRLEAIELVAAHGLLAASPEFFVCVCVRSFPHLRCGAVRF